MAGRGRLVLPGLPLRGERPARAEVRRRGPEARHQTLAEIKIGEGCEDEAETRGVGLVGCVKRTRSNQVRFTHSTSYFRCSNSSFSTHIAKKGCLPSRFLT